ncbi:DUF3179 domain-containing protein [Haloarcula litorea]|uniref:DUF3179 domain-containing protein n=1 Tax=Haloarcula litorea TaxID=3032579 RepID=UPI0023E817CA|nr:DUF3179 domain-containing protein [Halomicroarcula sp. GDY20]
MGLTRRDWLRAAGALGAAGLAGCTGTGGPDGGGRRTAAPGTGDTTATATPGTPPPTADRSLYLGHAVDHVDENLVSGGVPKDGIPSIDDPTFAAAGETPVADGDPVFGVARNGEAKAYPQYILVHHEIVNDTVGGDPVAVTYCPLTGTAQGFERGETTFGVSGRLVNSNLTMYDRGTDTWWPQVLATGVRGPLRGETLEEFRVVWTTWKQWRSAHPDTQVLTEDTGYTRRYGDDPYGDYNPRAGYYDDGRTLFSPLVTDDRAHPKRVVLGTRTTEGALTFDEPTLLDERVLTGDVAGTEYVAVADAALSTGYVYANPDGLTVTAEDGGYRVDGGTHAADALPLDRSLAFDGMWFAWAGFYPGVGYVR